MNADFVKVCPWVTCKILKGDVDSTMECPCCRKCKRTMCFEDPEPLKEFVKKECDNEKVCRTTWIMDAGFKVGRISYLTAPFNFEHKLKPIS